MVVITEKRDRKKNPMTCTLEVPLTTTVGDLKNELFRTRAIPIFFQRLLFNKGTLQDGVPLGEQGVSENSVLELHFPLIHDLRLHVENIEKEKTQLQFEKQYLEKEKTQLQFEKQNLADEKKILWKIIDSCEVKKPSPQRTESNSNQSHEMAPSPASYYSSPPRNGQVINRTTIQAAINSYTEVLLRKLDEDDDAWGEIVKELRNLFEKLQ